MKIIYVDYNFEFAITLMLMSSIIMPSMGQGCNILIYPLSYWEEEKGTKEDEMVGWHLWFDGHESEQTPGVGDGQGSLECCRPWGHKELGRDWATKLKLLRMGFNCYFLNPPVITFTSQIAFHKHVTITTWNSYCSLGATKKQRPTQPWLCSQFTDHL